MQENIFPQLKMPTLAYPCPNIVLAVARYNHFNKTKWPNQIQIEIEVVPKIYSFRHFALYCAEN